MAFTKDDIDAIDAAIASGELTVTIDGRSVQYRSINELLRAKAHIQQAIGKRRSPFFGSRIIVDRGIR
ncbi:MAG: phage head-tail joining protein [Aeromonadaceae bacterium]